MEREARRWACLLPLLSMLRRQPVPDLASPSSRSFLPRALQKSKYQVKKGTQLFSKFLKGQEEKAQKEEEEARKAGGDANPDDQQVGGRGGVLGLWVGTDRVRVRG